MNEIYRINFFLSKCKILRVILQREGAIQCHSQMHPHMGELAYIISKPIYQ